MIYIVYRGQFRPSKIIGGGGGVPRTTSISYSAKVCTVTITRSVLKNRKTFMYIARKWMFNYPCLSKQGDETKLQSFNLKETLNGSWDFM